MFHVSKLSHSLVAINPEDWRFYTPPDGSIHIRFATRMARRTRKARMARITRITRKNRMTRMTRKLG
jgi:hypothetical protein